STRSIRRSPASGLAAARNGSRTSGAATIMGLLRKVTVEIVTRQRLRRHRSAINGLFGHPRGVHNLPGLNDAARTATAAVKPVARPAFAAHLSGLELDWLAVAGGSTKQGALVARRRLFNRPALRQEASTYGSR